MKSFSLSVTIVALLSLPMVSRADQQVFTLGSPGVSNAMYSDGFFVLDTAYGGLFGASAYSYDFHLEAFGAGYSDAGLVVGLNGGLTLGKLQGVSVQSNGSPLAVNLWLDTGGDGKFFAFKPNGLLTSLNGDSYAGCGTPAIGAASNCYMLGGAGAGGTHTLAGLRAGSVAGIDGDTPVSLWIGVTNSGNQRLTADIESITVTTAAVPEPGLPLLLGANLGLVGVIAMATRRRWLRRA